MSKFSLQTQSYGIAGAGLVACVLLWVYFAFWQNVEPIDIASLVGSVASLVALFVALLQIASIRRTSEATKKAVEETQSRIVRNVSVADISDALRLIEQIEMLLQRREYKSVWLRLKDLQAVLEQLRGIELSSEESRLTEIESPLKIINLELSNLARIEDEYNPSNLNRGLQELSEVLNQEKGRLTYE